MNQHQYDALANAVLFILAHAELPEGTLTHVWAIEEAFGLAPGQLAGHLKDNSERFRLPPVLSFEQVVFDAPAPGDGSGTALEAAMAARMF